MTRITGMTVLALASTVASAQTPFIETYAADNASWTDVSSNPLSWDAGGFVTTTVSAVGIDPQFGALAFRGHASNGASGGAFAGDYLATGIDTISFDVRHNATEALGFYVRVATPVNFPAVLFVSPVLVNANEWTSVSFSIDPNSPFTIPEGGPGTFESVMANVGNFQVGFGAPLSQTTGEIVVNLDNVAIAPSPASAALLGLGGLVATRRRR